MPEKKESIHEHILDVRLKDNASKEAKGMLGGLKGQFTKFFEQFQLTATIGGGMEKTLASPAIPPKSVQQMAAEHIRQAQIAEQRPGIGQNLLGAGILGGAMLSKLVGTLIKDTFEIPKNLRTIMSRRKAEGASPVLGEEELKGKTEFGMSAHIMPVFLTGVDPSVHKQLTTLALGTRRAGPEDVDVSKVGEGEKHKATIFGSIIKKMFTAGKTRALSIWVFLGKAMAPVLDLLANTLMPLMVPLQEFLMNIIVSVLQPLVARLLPKMQDLFLNLSTRLLPTFVRWGQKLGDWLMTLIDWFAGEGVPMARNAFNVAVDFIKNLMDWGVFLKESLSSLMVFMTSFKNGFIAFGEWLGEAAWAVWDFLEPVRKAIMNFGQWLGEVGYKAWDLLVKIFDKVSGWVKKVGKWLGFGKGEERGDIQEFQRGGLVTSTGPALVHQGETVFPSGYSQESLVIARNGLGQLRDISYILSQGFSQLALQTQGAAPGSSIVDDVLRMEGL